MGNEQNLRRLTSEEAREIGKKGGKASVEARRKRRTLKEELLLMLEDENVQKKLCASLLSKAIDKEDTRAFEVIRDSIGEKEVEKIETITSIKVDLEDE